jgi:tungstate transport system substrate-binding protein
VKTLLSLWCGLLLAASAASAAAEGEFITLASTTSTENSGLLGELIPQFRGRTGIDVRVVAVGTGRALEMARRGDADVLLVHDRRSEDRFVEEGWGVDRRDVMYNDFILVGPEADPAGVRGGKGVPKAMSRIAGLSLPFVSRGDDSGTNKAELRLWKAAGLDPSASSGSWYRETGSGMGACLNTAAAMGAYTIADRGTWLSFGNRQGLTLIVEGDPRLANPYGVILVNPARHPHVKERAARAFVDWLVSAEGQAAIAAFRVAGEPLFHPSAGTIAASPDVREPSGS